MKNNIVFNVKNIDITDIMRQIRENIKTRGHDVDELKNLKQGVKISSPSNHQPVSQRLDENLYQANLTYFVKYWWPIKNGHVPLSFIKTTIKKTVRKLLYFYMKHVTDQQVIFNANAVRSLNDLRDYCKALELEKNELSKKLDNMYTVQNELVSRLERLEFAKNKDANNGFSEKLCYDYNNFEEAYRGSFEDIKERQKQYVEYFKGRKNVIDIGCGRGEFLTLLKESGVGGFGIDLVKKNIEHCLDNGLNVMLGNGVDYLKGLSDESVDGIFAAQVIEHMNTDVLISLIESAYEKLVPGACMVLETLNPQCLMIYAECMYLDPTHSTPVHPETVRFFLKNAGFEDIEIKYFSPTDESFRLPTLSGYPEADKSIGMINHLLFGCREYAVIARK